MWTSRGFLSQLYRAASVAERSRSRKRPLPPTPTGHRFRGPATTLESQPPPHQSRPSPEPKVSTAITRPFLRRLERLIRKLIDGRFEGADDVWQLQLELLKLQQDVQAAIGDAKKQVKRNKNGWADLKSLRHLRWQTRRFGDAIAWVILDNDRQLIYPLGENERVAVGPETHGTRGMTAIAQALSSDGWGFPLIHDITDCLRIGDITFRQKGGTIKTVEVKTRVIDEQATGDSRTSTTYNVTVISSSDVRPSEQPGEAQDRRSLIPTQLGASSARIERQVRRLHVARAHQEALPDVLTDLGDGPFISTAALSSHPDYWHVLRRLIRNARKNGYASEAVERAFLYVAIYRPGEVDTHAVQDPRIVEDLRTSGILFGDDSGERNGIVLNAIPPDGRKGSQPFLPYFLYSLPQRAIIDILYGRLIIVVLTNRGRIVEALEKAGHEVTVQPKGTDPFASFVVWANTTDETGTNYRIGLHNWHLHIYEMIYEFKGLQYLIDVAEKMRDVAPIAIKSSRKGR
jgi:hypothetical protein